MSGHQDKTAPRPFVHIYTEANPNPNSMKFVMNFTIMEGSSVKDYPTAASAAESPLAKALFEKYGFVERVFFMSNFVTVTKSPETEWMEISPVLRAFFTEYFEEGNRALNEEADSAYVQETFNADDSETVKKIKGALDEYVRPAVEMDGGAITFGSYEESTGIVKVRLQGSCSGCPSSTITLKSGIENLLKRMVPGVQQVVAESM